VYDGKVEFYQASMREQNLTLPFDITNKTVLPRVDIVYMYADATGDIIDYLISKKVDGIIIAGVGNGNFNKAYTAAIKRATAAGIMVVRASRTPTGRVILENDAKEDDLGTIVSDDLTPQKARILLMLALTQTKNRKEIQRYFYTY
jgi:L-asparaginase